MKGFVVQKLNDPGGKCLDVEYRSTGFTSLDWALGGGVPKGRVLRVTGAEHAGKSTFSYLAIAQAQKDYPEQSNAIIDTEYAMNKTWMEYCGVNTDDIVIAQPEVSAQEIYRLIYLLAETGKFAYIVVDSSDGMTSKADMDSDWDESDKVAGVSKIHSSLLKALLPILASTQTTLIFTSQQRDLVGDRFGRKSESGGHAIKHYASQVINLRPGDKLKTGTKENELVVGRDLGFEVTKNKVGPCYRNTIIPTYSESGPDQVADLINFAKKIKVIEGTSWLKLAGNEDMKWNGTAKLVDAIRDEIDSCGFSNIYSLILDRVNELIRG